MTKINITNQEITLLQDYIKNSPLLLVQLKAYEVVLAYSGTTTMAIGLAMQRKPRTIALWLSDWKKRRVTSMFTDHKDNNNAGKLTKIQQEEVKQVLQSPLSDKGLPKEFWDIPQLKQYLKANFSIVYESNRSYHYLLKFSNLSFKYPDKFDLKRDEAFIAKRMKEIHEEIKPFLKNDSYEVFTVDEVRMDQEAIIRRVWLKKGQETIIKVDRNKQSQSYISFLNQKNFKCEVYEMFWQNSEEVLKAYELFLDNHPNKKIVIVWDNAPFHKSKVIREQLVSGGLLDRVHLIAMPPYAPDHNPIEHVWGVTKQAISNIQHPSFEQTKEACIGFINSRNFNYSF